MYVAVCKGKSREKKQSCISTLGSNSSSYLNESNGGRNTNYEYSPITKHRFHSSQFNAVQPSGAVVMNTDLVLGSENQHFLILMVLPTSKYV